MFKATNASRQSMPVRKHTFFRYGKPQIRNPIGGPGDPRVPVGDSPTGMPNNMLRETGFSYRRVVRQVPPGQWPGGMGGSPVPPTR